VETPPGGDGTTPTDDAEPTPDEQIPPSYPRGFTDSGLSTFLYAENSRALRETPFRATWSKLYLDDNRYKQERDYRANLNAAYGTWTRPRGDGGPVEIYRQGEDAYWRENLGGTYTYGNDKEGYNIRELTWEQEIDPLIRLVDWGTPERINEGRPAVWEVTGDSVTDDAIVPGYYEEGRVLSLASASLRADENGIIRLANAQYRIDEDEGDGAQTRFASQYRIEALGDTVAVPTPSWLSTAREQTPTLSATLTDDRKFVQVSVASGNRLEPQSTIVVSNDENSEAFYVGLEQPLETDTTAYISKPDDDSRVVRANISFGSPPSDATPVTLESTYSIYARRRTNNYVSSVAVTA
jgi:hypothetical protein